MDKKKKQTVILIVVLVAIFLVLGLVSFFGDRVTMNPAGTIGNTAGNLNNDGLFCEYNGTVYFSNANDNHKLYAMNPDETNVRKLSDLHVQNILAGGKYLYYFQLGDASDSGFGTVMPSKSFNRCDLKGNNTQGLTQDVIISAQLVDNYLYILTTTTDGPSFYKIKIDKSDVVQLADYEINPACAQNGTIYYNGTKGDHYLYGLDTTNDIPHEIWQGNLWYPALEGNYVYFLDVAENYRLCRYSLTEKIVEVLTDDRVDCFNVGNGYIYYQKNSTTEPQLKCMRTDGTDVRVIAAGNYTDINMTSQYVYFKELGVDSTMYHSALGSNWYDYFLPQ